MASTKHIEPGYRFKCKKVAKEGEIPIILVVIKKDPLFNCWKCKEEGSGRIQKMSEQVLLGLERVK